MDVKCIEIPHHHTDLWTTILKYAIAVIILNLLGRFLLMRSSYVQPVGFETQPSHPVDSGLSTCFSTIFIQASSGFGFTTLLTSSWPLMCNISQCPSDKLHCFLEPLPNHTRLHVLRTKLLNYHRSCYDSCAFVNIIQSMLHPQISTTFQTRKAVKGLSVPKAQHSQHDRLLLSESSSPGQFQAATKS